MRYFLHCFKINKWHRCQKYIEITKEIDICTAKFALKKSEKVLGYNLASQASTVAERITIAKQKIEDY